MHIWILGIAEVRTCEIRFHFGLASYVIRHCGLEGNRSDVMVEPSWRVFNQQQAQNAKDHLACGACSLFLALATPFVSRIVFPDQYDRFGVLCLLGIHARSCLLVSYVVDVSVLWENAIPHEVEDGLRKHSRLAAPFIVEGSNVRLVADAASTSDATDVLGDVAVHEDAAVLDAGDIVADVTLLAF